MSYTELITALLASIPAGGAAGALVIWLGKTTLSERIKNAIQHEYNEKLERQKSELGAIVQRDLENYRSEIGERNRVALEKWNLKYKACLDALDMVDSVWSNLDWNDPSHPEINSKIKAEDFSEANARHIMNSLILTCSSTDVVELYLKAMGIRASANKAEKLLGDTIQDLRNAVRKELGFGSELELNRETAWIAVLHKKQTPTTA